MPVTWTLRPDSSLWLYEDVVVDSDSVTRSVGLILLPTAGLTFCWTLLPLAVTARLPFCYALRLQPHVGYTLACPVVAPLPPFPVGLR